jgi:hypothetical protein
MAALRRHLRSRKCLAGSSLGLSEYPEKVAQALPKRQHRSPGGLFKKGHKSIVKDMRKKVLCVLIVTALLISMPLAPARAEFGSRKRQQAHEVDASTYLVDIASNAPSMEGAYPSETKKIVAILGRDSRKNPILIDPTGNDRELVVQAAAVYLASRSSEKRIVGIDWNALLSIAVGENETDAAFFVHTAAGGRVAWKHSALCRGYLDVLERPAVARQKDRSAALRRYSRRKGSDPDQHKSGGVSRSDRGRHSTQGPVRADRYRRRRPIRW